MLLLGIVVPPNLSLKGTHRHALQYLARSSLNRTRCPRHP
jgi:hypothetical protein